jgi:hypothetical protein
MRRDTSRRKSSAGLFSKFWAVLLVLALATYGLLQSGHDASAFPMLSDSEIHARAVDPADNSHAEGCIAASKCCVGSMCQVSGILPQPMPVFFGGGLAIEPDAMSGSIDRRQSSTFHPPKPLRRS